MSQKDKNLKNWEFMKFLKNAIVMLMDFVLFSVNNATIIMFTHNGNLITPDYDYNDYSHFVFVGCISVLICYFFGLYRSIWSYGASDEFVRGIGAAFIESAFLFVFDRCLFRFAKMSFYLPFYAYIMLFVFLIVCIIIPRLTFRFVKRGNFLNFDSGKKYSRVMIIGAGFMGNFVIDALANDNYKGGIPVVAIDDNPQKKGKKINGVKVAGNCNQIPELAAKYKVDQIILCLPSASKERQREIINIAMETGCKIKTSPSVEEMFDETSSRKIRNVDIVDLLSRPEVKLDKKVCRYLIGSTILVTGGGGSIGAELCTQVARYSPKTIIIFDIYENCAFELQNELNDRYGDVIDVQVRIGSVRDIDRLRDIFEEFHPDVVFHAAAHKHVPLMEDSPCEAVKNNVFGTYNVAVLCNEYKVDKMVILSTDKAVNPTNVMGCTKRICEVIVQYMDRISSETEYVAVRFGNVLGSHGSVIPIFKKQIEKGGPVKVTHPDITRYFMTIPEAAQLVCQAGGLAKGGEVFVLDMGEPVRIMDLAKNLIRLSGFTEDEIPIEIVGLRPGEKLYEELSMDSEMQTRGKTANEKIYVNQPIDVEPEKFERMMKALENIDNSNVREILMQFIPTYHPSEN